MLLLDIALDIHVVIIPSNPVLTSQIHMDLRNSKRMHALTFYIVCSKDSKLSENQRVHVNLKTYIV